jgi:hypothetical protein
MLKGPHVEGSFTVCVIWLIIVQKVCCVCGDSFGDCGICMCGRAQA